jgi:hypothetical protein
VTILFFNPEAGSVMIKESIIKMEELSHHSSSDFSTLKLPAILSHGNFVLFVTQ